MILGNAVLEKVISTALAQGADFAEVYLEDTLKRQFTLLDSEPQKAISGHSLGAGIRIFKGLEQIYVYTNDLSEEGLLRVAKQAAQALLAGQASVRPVLSEAQSFGRNQITKTNSADANWTRLREVDLNARAVNTLINQVQAELSEVQKSVQIVNSEGINSSETRNYLNAAAFAFAERGSERESGFDRLGRLGTSQDWDQVDFAKLGTNAGEQSLRILNAKWAPAGEMPVLIDNAFGGVIFHEACGHGLETTSVAKGASVFCEKLGQRVASECVTAIDDGTREGDYGSLAIDDEGEPTQKTVLIENGVLKSYLVDKMGARKTGYKITGSGRRQDYRFAPTSRMRNTFIAPGKSSFEEMIADIDYGLYAKKLGGGSVMPATGSYNFAVSEAFIVRNGQIEEQVKGASLIGTGIETLGRISKVGTNFELAAGTCGSISGMIPTTVGQPALLVSKLTVGGKS